MKYFYFMLTLVFLFSCKTTSKQLNKNTSKESDAIMIRWSEEYGSVCCTRDPQHDNHILDYAKKFESENNLELGDSYKLVFGREGEGLYCLTLNGLTNKQRKKFILNRYPNISKEREEKLLDRINNPIVIEEIITPWKLERFTKF